MNVLKNEEFVSFWEDIWTWKLHCISLSKMKPLKFIKQKSKKISNKSHNNNDKNYSVPQHQR
jgi:hypothetical protein